jgi:uncharacterized protein YjbI with pentapeptide repeats
MANPEHIEILKQGVKARNQWRDRNDNIMPDLSMADLIRAELPEANLKKANLSGAFLHEANLIKANLRKSNLYRANLREAFLHKADLSQANLNETNLREAYLLKTNLMGANLRRADIREADLNKADLSGADLDESDLSGANLRGTILRGSKITKANLKRVSFVETILEDADLSNSSVYGISAWKLSTNQNTKQENLIITDENEPAVAVDNLEVAQFVYLLLHNDKIRNVIDTIGKKGVLILGRFSPERKAILEAIRNRLRELGFIPMMFDFQRPNQRDFTETIKTLAGMSQFIIADITNPKSALLELQATMPDYMIPFVPIIQEKEEPFLMFRDLKQKYGEWVLDVLEYDSAEGLIDVLDEAVVQPALDKAYELIDRKAEDLKKRQVKDYKNKPDICCRRH